MNISFNWLKTYVDFDLSAQEVAEALTSIGLEVGTVEEVQSVKGGLEGLLLAERLILACVSEDDRQASILTHELDSCQVISLFFL